MRSPWWMGLICQNSIPLAFVDCVICWAAELTQVDISRKKHKRPLKVHVAVNDLPALLPGIFRKNESNAFRCYLSLLKYCLCFAIWWQSTRFVYGCSALHVTPLIDLVLFNNLSLSSRSAVLGHVCYQALWRRSLQNLALERKAYIIKLLLIKNSLWPQIRYPYMTRRM